MRRPAIIALIAALLGLGVVVALVAPAAAQGAGICHPVNGKGNTGLGYNLEHPADASVHIDEALYPDGHYWKHESNDGLRHDDYADSAGHCPGWTPPETQSPTPTPSVSVTPSETSTPTPTITESESPSPTPTPRETPPQPDQRTFETEEFELDCENGIVWVTFIHWTVDTHFDEAQWVWVEDDPVPHPGEPHPQDANPSDCPTATPTPHETPTMPEPSRTTTRVTPTPDLETTPPAAPPELAQTGTDVLIPLYIAACLLTAGGVLFYGSRKRRRHQH